MWEGYRCESRVWLQVMAQELCTCVGLRGKDLSGKLVQIEEAQGSSAASSVVSSVLWNLAQEETSLVLVTLHHGETHYRSLCKKLGFDLEEARQKKRALVLDPFHMSVGKDKPFSNIDMSDREHLEGLFFAVEEAVNSLSGRKALIIDDLSGLVCLGASVGRSVSFVQQCRALQKRDKHLSLIICNHVSKDCEDLKTLSNWIFHVADFRIGVSGLKTGFSANVTGSLDVIDHLKDRNFAEQRVLHFKLTDRQIKVFAPGTVGIRS